MEKTPNEAMRSVKTMRRIVKDYGRRINASASVFTVPHGDGPPYIEVADDAYYFVFGERGKEFERRRTDDPDELL